MRVNPNKMRVNPTTPPGPYIPWRTREEAWEEFAGRIEAMPWGPMRKKAQLVAARIEFERNDPPWCWEEYLPEEAQSPEREPLAQMREAYERLLPEFGRLTIKAQHYRVLRDLGIKGAAAGYGYETFRTKVVARVNEKNPNLDNLGF